MGIDCLVHFVASLWAGALAVCRFCLSFRRGGVRPGGGSL